MPTDPKQGWGGVRPNSGRRKIHGPTIEARITTNQSEVLELLREELGLSTSAIVRVLLATANAPALLRALPEKGQEPDYN